MRDTFVSIACYQDLDVINTVQSMLESAAFPEKLRIVIVVQDDQRRWSLYRRLRSDQVELYFFDLEWAEGAGKARAEVLKHYEGEMYFFQSDSHMRFSQNWDQMLKVELAACAIEKPVLTTFPPNFDLETGNRDPDAYVHIMLHKFYRGLPITVGVSTDMNNFVHLDRPRRTPFVAAGVLFTLGTFITDVPCDPYYFFTGEEIDIAWRGWTHGYTFFSPRFCFCYHAYRNDRNKRYLATCALEHSKEMFYFERSIERAQVKGGIKQQWEAQTTSLIDIERYGLGNVRTLQSWESEFGINLATSTALPEAFFDSTK